MHRCTETRGYCYVADNALTVPADESMNVPSACFIADLTFWHRRGIRCRGRVSQGGTVDHLEATVTNDGNKMVATLLTTRTRENP
jgi:hypothetical protein